MPLYKLSLIDREDRFGEHAATDLIVRAYSKQGARRLAASREGDQDWKDISLSTCERVFEDGQIEVVLRASWGTHLEESIK